MLRSMLERNSRVGPEKKEDYSTVRPITRSQARAAMMQLEEVAQAAGAKHAKNDENGDCGAISGTSHELQQKRRRRFEDASNSENIRAGTKRLKKEDKKEEKKEDKNEVKKEDKKEEKKKTFTKKAKKDDSLSLSSESKKKRKNTKTVKSKFEVLAPKPISSKTQDSQWDLSKLSVCINSLLNHPPAGVEDIDEQEKNYFNAPEYAMDILHYLMRRESEHKIPVIFLDTQADINPMMRSVLVDWMIQVQHHLVLQEDTLHLAILLTDEFLLKRPVTLAKLQLIGVSCILIAAKFMERFTPEVSRLVHLTDDTYTEQQVLRMERVILNELNFDINLPVPEDFLSRFLHVAAGDLQMQHMCHYILDLILTDIVSVGFSSSEKAAGAVYLARHLLAREEREQQELHLETLYKDEKEGEESDKTDNKDEDEEEENDKKRTKYSKNESEDLLDGEVIWPKRMHYYTTYGATELMPVIVRMAKMLVRAPKAKFQGARTKYTSRSGFAAISLWPPMSTSSLLFEIIENSTTK